MRATEYVTTQSFDHQTPRALVPTPTGSYNRGVQLPPVDLTNPDDVFGVSIFTFFVLAVVAFMYISYKFLTQTGTKIKKGEKVMVYFSLVGILLVLVYAMLAFVFKIII